MQTSPPFKVRLTLLRYARLATINYSLWNYGLNTITSGITDHVRCIPVQCNSWTNHGPRKQLHNLPKISIIFSVIGSRAGFHLSADK